MRRLLHLRLLLTVLVVALVAACSGSGEETPTGEDGAAPAATSSATEQPSQDATSQEAGDGDNVLAAAVDTSAETSARFRLSTTAQGAQGEVTTSGEGVSSADGASRVTLTIEGAGAQLPGQEGPLEIETIFVDGVIYQRIPGFGEQLGTDAEWFSIDAESALPGFEQLIEQAEQADPTQSFELLQQVADVEEVGTEEINGVSTTHYQGQARLGDLLEASGVDLGNLPGGADIDEDQQVPIDVWLDEDGRVRRVQQEIEVQGTTTSTTIDILEYGIDVDIEPPPADDTADLAELVEQAQQQGAGGGTSEG